MANVLDRGRILLYFSPSTIVTASLTKIDKNFANEVKPKPIPHEDLAAVRAVLLENRFAANKIQEKFSNDPEFAP